MSNKLFKTPLSNWIRGAQTTVHEGLMLIQSVRQVCVIGIFVILLTSTYYANKNLDTAERHYAVAWVKATVYLGLVGNDDFIMSYKDNDGQTREARARDIYDAPIGKDIKDKAVEGAIAGVKFGGSIVVVLLGALFALFQLIGSDQERDTVLRGTVKSNDIKSVQKMLKREGKKGVIEIGSVTLPHKLEASHMLFVGGPGTGKSQQLINALDGVRAAKRRAIVYDINGTYVEKFYRPGIDVILNPLDERSPAWNLWSEIRHTADFARIAEALLPSVENEKDKFWTEAPQLLFAEAAKLIYEHKDNPKNDDLIKLLMRAPLKKLAKIMQNTDAVTVIDPDNPKTSASVRTVLAAALKGFLYLGDKETKSKEDVFSIKDFILDESHDSWLFITSNNDHLSALKPLISLWVDIATNTILSLPPDSDRRLYLFFDELTSLSKLPSLENAMAQSRKHGGSIALGFQSIAQMQETYGPKETAAITGNCSTWSILRINDNETAEWASKGLGASEITETSESLSISKHDMGDRRTIQKQKSMAQTVLPSELRQLRDLRGYLLMGRGYPVLEIDVPISQLPDVSEAFVTEEISKKPNAQKINGGVIELLAGLDDDDDDDNDNEDDEIDNSEADDPDADQSSDSVASDAHKQMFDDIAAFGHRNAPASSDGRIEPPVTAPHVDKSASAPAPVPPPVPLSKQVMKQAQKKPDFQSRDMQDAMTHALAAELASRRLTEASEHQNVATLEATEDNETSNNTPKAEHLPRDENTSTAEDAAPQSPPRNMTLASLSEHKVNDVSLGPPAHHQVDEGYYAALEGDTKSSATLGDAPALNQPDDTQIDALKEPKFWNRREHVKSKTAVSSEEEPAE